MGACVLCEEQITNPLSPERLQEQVTAWLLESKPELVDEFVRMSADFVAAHRYTRMDKCIITGKWISLCPYCYTDRVLKWLLTVKPDAALVKEFFAFFDFDAQGMGYHKEASHLGFAL